MSAGLLDSLAMAVRMKSHFPTTVLFFSLIAGAVSAQDETNGLRSTADGVYTQDQANRGQKTYDEACLRCHPVRQFIGSYVENWSGNTVGALYESIASTMPEERPGSLKSQEYSDILAYIFGLNRFPQGKDELASDLEVLRKILIERREK